MNLEMHSKNINSMLFSTFHLLYKDISKYGFLMYWKSNDISMCQN